MANKLARIFLILILLILNKQIFSVTIVYNMKIRRIFAVHPSLRLEKKNRWVASVLPYFYKRKRRIFEQTPIANVDICDRTLNGGNLFDLRFVSTKNWWVEITTGVAKESLKTRGTSNFDISRVGFDDIIFSPGYNIFPNKKSQISIYVLAGFPTRTKVNIEETFDTLVGTRFFGLGTGLEFSYNIFDSPKRVLAAIAQYRFIHFFKRQFFPVLPRNSEVQPGNVTDFLFTLLYINKTKSGAYETYEVGYNPTIFSDQAILLPNQTIRTKTYVRHSGYFNYKHLFKKFKLFNKPTIFGAGFSLAHEKRFHSRIFACWVQLAIVF